MTMNFPISQYFIQNYYTLHNSKIRLTHPCRSLKIPHIQILGQQIGTEEFSLVEISLNLSSSPSRSISTPSSRSVSYHNFNNISNNSPVSSVHPSFDSPYSYYETDSSTKYMINPNFPNSPSF